MPDPTPPPPTEEATPLSIVRVAEGLEILVAYGCTEIMVNDGEIVVSGKQFNSDAYARLEALGWVYECWAPHDVWRIMP